MTSGSVVTPTRARCPMLLEAGDVDSPVTVLEGHHKADVCIVGGGYLGLWTAIELRRADAAMSIAVVEADVCGGGASGRNSGMALPYWSKFQALAAQCGPDEALRLCEESVRAIDDLQSFSETYAIDIEFERTGWLWGATCRRQEGRWGPLVEALSRYGRSPFREIDRNGIDAMFAAPGMRCGVFDPSAASIQPARLARGLRAVALRCGINIFEHTPMRHLERAPRAGIETPCGSVSAGTIVLAMNAWSAAIAELRRGILVITSDDAITGPARSFLEERRWTGGPIVTDAGVFVSGFRPTRDGRIVGGVTGGAIGFGSLRNQRFEGRSPRDKAIGAAFRRAFGAGAQVRFERSWRGPVDRTRSGLPVFGNLPRLPRILFGYGFSGNGIVGCRLGSRILASLVLEQKDDWATSGLVSEVDRWMPPEPVRYLGAHLVRSAVRQKDRFDHEGVDQGPVARMLAALAPGGIVTTSTSD